MTDLRLDIPPASTKDLRNFGLTFGGVASVFGLLFLWRGRVPIAEALGVAAVLFFAAGLFFPGVLRPFHAPWMKFAEILGYVNTRLLLGLFFFVGVTPMGLAMRLSGKDPMGRSFKAKDGKSYWTEATRHVDGVRHFDRQF